MQRVFLAGRSTACRARQRGLCSLAILLKIGSDLRVVVHHRVQKTEIVALSGGFFVGCAKRKPTVSRGEMGNCHAFGVVFCFSGRLRLEPTTSFCAIMKVENNSRHMLFLWAEMATSQLFGVC